MLVSDFRPDRSKEASTALNGVVESTAAVYREPDNTFLVFWSDTEEGWHQVVSG